MKICDKDPKEGRWLKMADNEEEPQNGLSFLQSQVPFFNGDNLQE